MESNFEFFFLSFFLLEKPEKLNIKFRLAKEGEFAEGETESTTIQLVLEQSETYTETNNEAASLMRENQETCSSPQKDPESSPWQRHLPWPRSSSQNAGLLLPVTDLRSENAGCAMENVSAKPGLYHLSFSQGDHKSSHVKMVLSCIVGTILICTEWDGTTREAPVCLISW